MKKNNMFALFFSPSSLSFLWCISPQLICFDKIKKAHPQQPGGQPLARGFTSPGRPIFIFIGNSTLFI